MIIRSKWIVILLIAINVVISQECDPAPYQTHDDLLNCINSVPFSQSIKDQTLITLSMILPSYVFIDSLMQSPDPTNIPLSVNLTNSLQQINQTDYSTDAAFQDAVVSLFTAAQDGNTLYKKPLIPYSIATFALPFQIYSIVTGNQQQIIINADEDLITIYNTLYPPISSSSFDGSIILEIDNQPVLDVLSSFANNSVGFSKDFNARFNLAVDGGLEFERGLFTFRNQELLPSPSNSSVSLLIQDITGLNQTITLSWIGLYNATFPIPSQNNRTIGDVELHRVDMNRKEGIMIEEEEESTDATIYYEIINGVTGVLRIKSFEEQNQLENIKKLEEGTCKFKESKIESLIIDLTGASGNNYCYAMSLLNFLFPEFHSFENNQKHQKKMAGGFDIKASDLFNEFAEKGSELLNNNPTLNQFCQINPQLVGLFTPCAWNEYDSPSKIFYDDSWFFPSNLLTRGGVTSSYSSFFTQNCDANSNFFLPGESASPFLSISNIILLSDGLCSSSCAVFARFLQLNERVKTVVVGGVLGAQTASFTSSPGGEFIDLDYIFTLADKYGVTDETLVPPPLPTTATFQFTVRELLGWEGVDESSIPQEFVYLPADFQMYYSSDPKNKTAVWQQATQYFSKCASWEGKPCPILNGQGEIKCKDQTYPVLNPVCEIVSCNPGYGLSADLGTCFPCDVGFYNPSFGLGPCLPCSQKLPQNCRYTETGVTASNCPFACGDCLPCEINPGGIVDVNSVCLQPWVFFLVLLFVIVGSFILAALVSIFLIVRAVRREEMMAAQRKPVDLEDEPLVSGVENN